MDTAEMVSFQVFLSCRVSLTEPHDAAMSSATNPVWRWGHCHAFRQSARAKRLNARYEGLGRPLWRSSPEESQKLQPPCAPGTGSRQSNQNSRPMCQCLRLSRTSLKDL